MITKKQNEYTLTINLKSSLITHFQSDTLFGHICWAIRFLYGESSGKLDEFLASYKNQDMHPLIISNGFPKGFLPKPVISPIHPDDLDGIVGREDRIGKAGIIKEIKDLEYIPKEIFIELIKTGSLNPKRLFNALFLHYGKNKGTLLKEIPMVIQHNSINRLNQTATGLFFQEERFFEKGGNSFEIYLKTSMPFDEIEGIFHFISEQGYGRDKSTGKGHFEFDIKEGIDLPESDHPNAFMTLSSYIPHDKAPTNGHYRLIHKYGKLGGTFAIGKNPFKMPLIMFAAGSTFYDIDFNKDKVYGQLISDVHRNLDIKHYGYAFPIGIQIDEASIQ